MLANMEQLNFDHLLKNRTNVPRDISKAELWHMLQQQQARLDSQQEMTNFSARIPKSLAQNIRSAAHLQGRTVQDVTAEALTLWLNSQED